MSYLVFDAETTVRNNPAVSEYTVGEEWGSPFHPDNEIVLCGWKREGTDSVLCGADSPLFTHEDTVLIGHNLRFDMHYLDKNNPDFHLWLSDPLNSVWDTQIVEYLLTAQGTKFASLDELSELYGGTLKDSGIKEFWNNGGQTEDLPLERLQPYLEGDVLNTEKIYLEQLHMAQESGMLPLIKTQMRALVATWEMRKNGMCFNMQKALQEADSLSSRIQDKVAVLTDIVESKHPKAERGTVNPGSNDVLSRILFGGSYVYYTQEPVQDADGNVVRYKSGKRKGEVKTKKTENKDYVQWLCTPDIEWKTKKEGVYQVGDYQLNTLLARGVPKEAEDIIKKVKELRALEKDRTTYFVGYSKLAWKEGNQFFIHGDLNLCQTETGRLSSSKPNMQNLSGKDR